MKDNIVNVMDIIWVVTVCIGMVVAGYVGEKEGKKKGRESFQKELVTKGIAEYNSTNGVWQLKESGK